MDNEETRIEVKPQQQQQKNRSIIVISDSLDEEDDNEENKEKSQMALGGLTTTNLVLKLSSSSSSLSSNENDKITKPATLNVTSKKTSKVSFMEPPPVPSPPQLPLPKRRSNNTKTNSKKRVSVCGQTFSDVVLNIDDTILDEYENELDHKSGKIFTLHESSIEKDMINPNSQVLSSTKARIIEEEEKQEENDEEDSSDEMEKCNIEIIFKIKIYFYSIQINFFLF